MISRPEPQHSFRTVGLGSTIPVPLIAVGRGLQFGLHQVHGKDHRPPGDSGNRGRCHGVPPPSLRGVCHKQRFHPLVASKVTRPADRACRHLGRNASVHPAEPQQLYGLFQRAPMDLQPCLCAVRGAQHQGAEQPAEKSSGYGDLEPREWSETREFSFPPLEKGKDQGDDHPVEQQADLNPAVEPEDPEGG